LPKPRPSATKRQREQKKQDRQIEKKQRRVLRKAAAVEGNDKEQNGLSGSSDE